MGQSLRKPNADVSGFPDILKSRIGETYKAISAHSRMVEAFSAEVAKEMGLNPESCYKLRLAAIFHDVGKVKVPPHVLAKVSGTRQEWEMMRSHVMVGEELDRMGLPPEAVEAVENHHERWDGSGYPGGKVGDDIPLMARILAVADVYASAADASLKPHPPLDTKTPAEALKALSGKKLDPKVVDAALKAMRRRNR